MHTQPIRIVIADDHAIFRDGLRRLLATQEDFQVIGEASDGKEAIAFATDLRTDVLLLDLAMPRVPGMEVLRELAHQEVVVLTSLPTGATLLSSATSSRRVG